MKKEKNYKTQFTNNQIILIFFVRPIMCERIVEKIGKQRMDVILYKSVSLKRFFSILIFFFNLT